MSPKENRTSNQDAPTRALSNGRPAASGNCRTGRKSVPNSITRSQLAGYSAGQAIGQTVGGQIGDRSTTRLVIFLFGLAVDVARQKEPAGELLRPLAVGNVNTSCVRAIFMCSACRTAVPAASARPASYWRPPPGAHPSASSS
jgi:hypothetical protein